MLIIFSPRRCLSATRFLRSTFEVFHNNFSLQKCHLEFELSYNQTHFSKMILLTVVIMINVSFIYENENSVLRDR